MTHPAPTIEPLLTGERMTHEFKEGDIVAVTSTGFGGVTQKKSVQKVTPSGLVKVDGTLYGPGGYSRTKGPRTCIQPWSERHQLEMDRDALGSALYRVGRRVKYLPPESVESLLKAAREALAAIPVEGESA